jgi:hypothetical protein
MDSLRFISEATSRMNSREKVIVFELARRAALSKCPTVSKREIGLYNEDPPIWYDDRTRIMNERRCDNEENGTRAWMIASKLRVTRRVIQSIWVPNISTSLLRLVGFAPSPPVFICLL